MMRRLIPAAAALALFAATAQAQNQPTTTTPGATQAPSATAPAKKPAAHRMTLQQRFDAANTTHDGHLTKDQAAAANWSYVVNNFAAIDKGKKGYVTVQDIHSFARERHAARHHKPAATPGATQAPAQSSG
jgi:hypothetical protein